MAPSVLVIVFQIEVTDFVLCRVDTERQTPGPRDVEAPCTLAVACQRMRFPSRERPQFLGVLHVIEVRQHFAKFIDRIGRHSLRAVFQVEPL